MYPYSNPSFITRGVNFIKNIKWGNILDGTGKTLGVINQAIPIIYQVKPMFSNAKAILKIANGITENTTSEEKPTTSTSSTNIKNSPIFYID